MLEQGFWGQACFYTCILFFFLGLFGFMVKFTFFVEQIIRIVNIVIVIKPINQLNCSLKIGC